MVSKERPVSVKNIDNRERRVNTLTADVNRRVYHPLPVEIRLFHVCQLRLVAWQCHRTIYFHLPTTTRSMAMT